MRDLSLAAFEVGNEYLTRIAVEINTEGKLVAVGGPGEVHDPAEGRRCFLAPQGIYKGCDPARLRVVNIHFRPAFVGDQFLGGRGDHGDAPLVLRDDELPNHAVVINDHLAAPGLEIELPDPAKRHHTVPVFEIAEFLAQVFPRIRIDVLLA